MNRHFATVAAVLCAAAALRAAPAAAQTDTAAAVTAAAPANPAAPQAQEAVSTGDAVRAVRARRNINLITYEEVQSTKVADAYELIHNLRPSWLRTPRGSMSIAMQIDVAVFKDGVRMGSREALHTIPITAVRTIRFYTAVDARQKFGGDSSAGAIEISSR
ncbi:MAG TPA: hypothetical protein VFJ16_02450 [Longimicrobium sp.]|nr:hypothetical protein [Longimicrobium sp.]